MISKLLVANRGEIAIRAFRAANELGIASVAVYVHEDRHSLHRQKADESYEIGERGHPVRGYLDVDLLIALALRTGADAIYPGYGFLSESPQFAQACAAAGVTFVGPSAAVLSLAGNKIRALEAARAAGLPVLRALTGVSEPDELIARADDVGFPLFVKAAAGGGGRGLRRVENRAALAAAIDSAAREASSAFGDGTVFLEEAVTEPRHIEVQVLADAVDGIVHLFERDCSLQRRHQKVVEIAPAPNLDGELRMRLCDEAVAFASSIGYVGAGTVEFLVDRSGRHVFIEMNPRIQVEHTVTEEVTSVDLVQAQLRIAAGERLEEFGLDQQRVEVLGAALQCRITAEDPAHDFRPDTGVITTYRAPGGSGIRLDEGVVLGTEVLPYFDSLLAKLTCRGRTFEEAVDRARRAVAEFRIRGIATNIAFLQSILDNNDFRAGRVTTTFIDEHPELLVGRRSADRGTRLLTYLAEATVNRPFGDPPVLIDPKTKLPTLDTSAPAPRGTRDLLEELGAAGFARSLREQTALAVTDTTFRDAHQSLLATRLRTSDVLSVAPHIARLLPQLFSLEAWGGATFDVALRFLHEDPWERLAKLRSAVPNICLQMLLRGRNLVGYAPYPDAVCRAFVDEAAQSGIDIFRIFDALNDVDAMRPAIDSVLESGRVAEGTLCYTGDLANPAEHIYTLSYFLDVAARLVEAGVHVLCIKDMAGLLRPIAARRLVSALRKNFDLPVRLHTHDTAGGQLAAYLAALDVGVDAVDGAMAPLAGATSQPSLSAIVAATEHGDRATGLDLDALLDLEPYFSAVRPLYRPFDHGLAAPTGRVYRHEIPGGQLSNLWSQAAAVGLGDRLDRVEELYAVANDLLGDIIKVTPTSKVVGDLALYLAATGTDPVSLREDPGAFELPDSVIGFLAGELGTPPGGWPEPFRTKALAKRNLGDTNENGDDAGDAARIAQATASLADTDGRDHLAGRGQAGRRDLLSELLFPGPAREYTESFASFGDLAVLPTSSFFYGLRLGEEIEVELSTGVALLLAIDAMADPDERGFRNVYCRLNGKPRIVSVRDLSATSTKPTGEKAAADDPGDVGAPFSGVVHLTVRVGDRVERGAVVATIEAMKMEARVTANTGGVVKRCAVPDGGRVELGDLVLVIGENA